MSAWVSNKRLEKKKTSILTKTLNPVYNESFTFNVSPDKIKTCSVRMQVMDYDKLSKDDVIGELELGLRVGALCTKHWTEMMGSKGQPVTHWHPLKEESKD